MAVRVQTNNESVSYFPKEKTVQREHNEMRLSSSAAAMFVAKKKGIDGGNLSLAQFPILHLGTITRQELKTKAN